MNVLYLYKDLLNLHGDKGNLLALEKISKAMNIKTKIDYVNAYEDKINFKKYDLILISPGELFVIKKIIERLRQQKEEIIKYIEENKYIICIGTSAAIFANQTVRSDKTTFDGLGIGDFTCIEREKPFGDDLIFKYKKNTIVGSQIVRIDIFPKKNNYLGKIIYGYGNNGGCYEGIKYKNLIITNTLGPLFIQNPQLLENIIKDIHKNKGINLNYKKIDYKIEKESQKEIIKFNQEKIKK